MTTDRNHRVIEVTVQTYSVLTRIKQDYSHPTYDMVIRKGLKLAYPMESADLD